jgi:hypothetical protein
VREIQVIHRGVIFLESAMRCPTQAAHCKIETRRTVLALITVEWREILNLISELLTSVLDILLVGVQLTRWKRQIIKIRCQWARRYAQLKYVVMYGATCSYCLSRAGRLDGSYLRTFAIEGIESTSDRSTYSFFDYFII